MFHVCKNSERPVPVCGLHVQKIKRDSSKHEQVCVKKSVLLCCCWCFCYTFKRSSPPLPLSQHSTPLPLALFCSSNHPRTPLSVCRHHSLVYWATGLQGTHFQTIRKYEWAILRVSVPCRILIHPDILYRVQPHSILPSAMIFCFKAPRRIRALAACLDRRTKCL